MKRVLSHRGARVAIGSNAALRCAARGRSSSGRAAGARAACRSDGAAARARSRSSAAPCSRRDERGRRRGSPLRARAKRAKPGASCTAAFTVSPHSSSGMPKTATSATAGCSASTCSTSAGIDVHAARDDHVRLAIAEIDEAVGVDPADVAERQHAGFEIGARGLLGVAVVDERLGHVAVSRVERAGLTGRQPAAVVVHRERFPVRAARGPPCRDAPATPANRRA